MVRRLVMAAAVVAALILLALAAGSQDPFAR